MYQSAARLLYIVFLYLTRDHAFGVIVVLMSQKDAVYLTGPKKSDELLNRPKRS